MKAVCLMVGLAAMPGAALAFDVMDPATVAPILEMTKGNWVALRPWEGEELLYFTHLESWRCAVSGVSYAVNGGAWMVWNLSPCQVGTPAPNALPDGYLPFVKLPADLVQDIAVRVEMKDGQVLEHGSARAAILIQ